MKVFNKIKKLSRKAVVLGVVTAAVVGVAGFKLATVDAQNIAIGGPSDNDSNAVIYGGAHNVNSLTNGYEGSGSVRDIYSYFGISRADVKSMNDKDTKVISGSVTRDGNVLDNDGKVIASNALTAGRQNIAGSNQVSQGGTTFFTRPPSVSFLSNSLQAFVVLNDKGEFKFAILAACGNPVKATPKHVEQPKHPDYTIEKQVKAKGSGDNFSKSVKVEAGDHVIYSVVVKSTGDSPALNVKVNDNLPSHVKFVNGTLTRNGDKVGAGRTDDFFKNGIKIDSIAPGTSERFTFEAVVGPNDTPEKCKDETLTNRGHIEATNLPPASSTANVRKECMPKPVYACENLNAIPLSRKNIRFNAKATAHSGAQVVGYKFIFGDGASKTITTHSHKGTVEHIYANLDAAKTYNASVSVMVKVNGKVTTVSGKDCKAKVKVAGKPLAECTGLKLTVGENRSITTQVSVTTKNGAKLTSVNYNFDDGTTKLVNNTQAVTHTYAGDGDFTVQATVTFTVKEKKITSVCQAPVTFNSTPPCTETNNNGQPCETCEESNNGQPCVSCEEMNGGQSCVTCQEQNGGQPCVSCEESNNGQPCVTCEKSNNGQVCEVTPTCDETVAEQGKGTCEEVPAELVNTGPGTVAGLFAATTAIGAIGYRYLLSRRLSQM